MQFKFGSMRQKLAVLTLGAMAALAPAGSVLAAGQGQGNGFGRGHGPGFGRGPGHSFGHAPGHNFGHAPGFRSGPVWRGNPGRFHGPNVWRGGHWAHGHHNGRFGWWWVAGGLWYLYPSPIYPYPGELDPPLMTYIDPDAAAPPPSSSRYWYYCAESNAYYPYVAACPGGWQRVPTTPDGAG